MEDLPMSEDYAVPARLKLENVALGDVRVGPGEMTRIDPKYADRLGDVDFSDLRRAHDMLRDLAVPKLEVVDWITVGIDRIPVVAPTR